MYMGNGQLELGSCGNSIEKVVDVKPRCYQSKCMDAIVSAHAAGVRRQLVVLPTGSGKTIIATLLPKVMGFTSILFLAQRIVLVNQAYRQFCKYYPDLRIDIERAEYGARRDANIVIASVDTLGRAGLRRLGKFSPDFFQAIVIDEAHHCTSKTHLNILKHFSGAELVLGITATPFRGDGVQLANVFDDVVYSRTIPELIDEGDGKPDGPYLSRLSAVRVKTGTDLTQLSVSMGDFNEGDLATEINIDKRNSTIISAIEDYPDRNCVLVFCAGISHVETLAQQLVDRGHKAVYVHSKMNDCDRARNFEQFKNGSARIMVNCAIYTEGMDIPKIDMIVLARPTLSPLLFMQMVGRGCRPFLGKKDCLILDFVDNCGRYKPRSIGDMFGVRNIDFLGTDVHEKSKVLQDAADMMVHIDSDDNIEDVERKVKATNMAAMDTVYISTAKEAVDLFEACAMDEDIQNESIFPWLKVSNEHYTLHMMNGDCIDLRLDNMGMWTVGNGKEQKSYGKCARKVPFTWADKFVKQGRSYRSWNAKTFNAKWRNHPATQTHIALLRNKFRIMSLPSGLTKGAACDLIDFIINAKKTRQVRSGSH